MGANGEPMCYRRGQFSLINCLVCLHLHMHTGAIVEGGCSVEELFQYALPSPTADNGQRSINIKSRTGKEYSNWSKFIHHLSGYHTVLSYG